MTTLMAFYCALAFVITYAENWISSHERAAERRSRTCRTRKWSIVSANWSVLFEVILLVDILLTVAEPLAILPFVVAGGWLGQFQAAERERKKFRANAGNVQLLRKGAKAASVSVDSQLGGTSAADAAVNTPKSTT